MALPVIAAILVAIGGIVFAVPSRNPKVSNRLVGVGMMGTGGVVLLANIFVVIPVGEVGVEHFLGNINERPLEPGVRIINPLASVEKMSIREQAYPPQGSVELIEAQTSEQLNVTLEVSIIYKILPENIPGIYREIGSESDMERQFVLNSVRNGVRDAVATKSINEIFSPNRRDVADAMRTEIQAKAGTRFDVEQVFLRDVQAPERVRDAIEQKLEREQQVAAEEFQTQIIQEQARQQAEEAKGIAEAQRIISEGLTQEYLTFFYIQQLAQMPEGSLVYVPTEGGIPLIRNLGGGR